MFQYISCYSLSFTGSSTHVGIPSFNTSHVILYRGTERVPSKRNGVSIHLMLFFIRKNIINLLKEISFNTSHVILYPIVDTTGISTFAGFNTSHVILYREKAFGFRQSRRFNTSHVILYQRSGNACCTDGIRFNTSHVILYRTSSKSGFHLLSMFQYISCYSLSAISAASMAASAVFQYISCYSLSRAWGDMRI